MRKNPPLPPKKETSSRSQSIQRLQSNPNRKLELPAINRKRITTVEHERREPRKEDVAEEALNNLIHEYFIKFNYMETLATFQQEYYNAGVRE